MTHLPRMLAVTIHGLSTRDLLLTLPIVPRYL
jgi:hypothetical protein